MAEDQMAAGPLDGEDRIAGFYPVDKEAIPAVYPPVDPRVLDSQQRRNGPACRQSFAVISILLTKQITGKRINSSIIALCL